MKKFFRKAPQILVKTVTGQELSQGQKEAMRDFRGVINDTPNLAQQELEAQRQAAQQAEAARVQAQAQQQAAAEREAAARAQQEAANAEAAKLQAEAAELQAQLDAANARTAAAQEAKRVAEMKAQLAQLQAQQEPASAAGAGVSADSEKKVESASSATQSVAAAALPSNGNKSVEQPATDDAARAGKVEADVSEAINATLTPASNHQQSDEVLMSPELKARLTKLAQDIYHINTLQDSDAITQAKEQVKKEVVQHKLSHDDFEYIEKLVVESFKDGIVTPPDIDAFLNELEHLEHLEHTVPVTGDIDLDLTGLEPHHKP